MKKIIKNLHIFLFLIFVGVLFTSCFPTDDRVSKKVNIVCTIFPTYDWVQQIVGNSSNVTYSMVIKNGIDMHSFQPSASDIIQIQTCDIFIYIGGPSENWVEEVLKNRTNKDMTILRLMDYVQIKEEGEALQVDSDSHEEEVEYDEHIWLSINNSIPCVEHISKAIIEKDSENKAYYEEKTSSYISELNTINEAYRLLASGAPDKTLVFCDRFPFTYLFDELNLKYIAAFAGCSAETEASFDTITKLTQAVEDQKSKSVLKIEGSDDKLAKTVLANSKYFDIISLDSMQSVSLRQAFNGKTYKSLMMSNLESLKKAFSK